MSDSTVNLPAAELGQAFMAFLQKTVRDEVARQLVGKRNGEQLTPRDLRNRTGRTLRDVARGAAVHRDTLSKLERGVLQRLHRASIERVAAELGVALPDYIAAVEYARDKQGSGLREQGAGPRRRTA